MSVPSWNTTVTTEMPYFEIERICVVLGMPAMARSMGTVTYCSISTGERAGAEVMTCTWIFVTSGTASMESVRAAFSPSRANSKVATRTSGRFRKDQPMMAEKSPTSVDPAKRVLQDGALEREHALDHHLFALTQPCQHLHFASGTLTERELVQLEVRIRLAHEHDVLARNLRERSARHHQRGLRVLHAPYGHM